MPPAPALLASSHVSDFVEAYEAARANGDPAPLDDFLPDPSDPQFCAVLAELVRVEMEYAWRSGQTKPLDGYRQSYPDLFDDPAILSELAFEEYRLRRSVGEPATPAEYRRRFGIDVSRWLTEAPYPEMQKLSRIPYPDRDAEPDGEFPKVGSTFLGFRLHAELGRGAFGRVYLAHQGDLADRPVALKITRDARVETQALARLQHTNVMPIYSAHHAPPFHAVCMPYFPGITLADLCRGFAGKNTTPESARDFLETIREKSSSLDARPAVSRPEALRPIENAWAAFHERSGTDAVVWIGARLADGLAHAHERGIVHRDLKPANILLTEDGQPLILDFNLADDAHAGGERAFLGGTLPYMAPEQLQAFLNGKAHGDPRSDIYALGLILYELLAGRPPFPVQMGDWRDAVIAGLADRKKSPPRLRPFNRAVSPALEAIVGHCLEPDPDRRYPTTASLHEDLQRQFDHLPLRHVREPSLRERVAKFFLRHPGVLSATRLGVVAFVAVVALSVGVIVRSQQVAALEARRDAERWLADAHPAHLMALQAKFDVDRSTESAAALSDLLGRYNVLDDANWFDSKQVRRLPAEDRERLRTEVGDLLILQARNVRFKAKQTPLGKDELFDQAARLNLLAEASFPPGSAPRAVWLQRAEIEQERGRVVEAERIREQAQRVSLRSARDYVSAAQAARKRNDILALLDGAKRLNPGDSNLWCLLGLCYRNVNQFDRALTCFDMSLILNSDQPWVNEVRGETRIAANDSARALPDLDIALAANPNWDEAQINRALARENVGDFAGAIADLSAVMERSPQHVELLFQGSRVKNKSRDVAGAKADAAQLLKRSPTTVRGWIARAMAQPDPRKALADLDEALILDPESETALQNRANILDERLHQPADSIAALDKLLTYHPESPKALAGRGVLVARRGDRDAAIRDARAALAADRSPFTVYQVAGIYAQTSAKETADQREALRLLAEAFRRQPTLLNLVATDTDLDPIRKTEAFRQLLDAARVLFKNNG